MGVTLVKIGLASYEFINRDIPFNISQMEKAMRRSSGKVDILCFGEAFLQGFDALEWDYEKDKHIAIPISSPIMRTICAMSLQYKIDLLFGYIERDDHAIYSSYALIENGKITHNYRRISKGWKDSRFADEHYKEGCDTAGFLYRDQPITIALCGDMWDFPEKFKADENGILIWPIYVNFTLDEWRTYEAQYAERALIAADRAFVINSISKEPKSHGGAFYFSNGKVERKLPYDVEDILIIELN